MARKCYSCWVSKVTTLIAFVSVFVIVGAVALQLVTAADAKTGPPITVKQTVKKVVSKVAGAMTKKNMTAQGTISSLRRPTCQGKTVRQIGVLTMQLANNHFIKFRIDCTDAYPATLQVGDTVKIGYQGSGLIREVVSRIIWLGQRHDRPLNLKVPSTWPGTGETAGDCPLCGNSEGGVNHVDPSGNGGT